MKRMMLRKTGTLVLTAAFLTTAGCLTAVCAESMFSGNWRQQLGNTQEVRKAKWFASGKPTKMEDPSTVRDGDPVVLDAEAFADVLELHDEAGNMVGYADTGDMKAYATKFKLVQSGSSKEVREGNNEIPGSISPLETRYHAGTLKVAYADQYSGVVDIQDSAVPLPSNTEDDSEDGPDGTTSTKSSTKSTKSTTLKVESTKATTGTDSTDPNRMSLTVTDGSFSERQYADYGVYAEALGSSYFMYSNIQNSGITDKTVYLDIPAGMTYTAEKDGVPFTYNSKDVLSDYGSYVFHFSCISDITKPLSQQTILQAVFNFRIQARDPNASTAAQNTGLPSGIGSVISGNTGNSTGSSTGNSGPVTVNGTTASVFGITFPVITPQTRAPLSQSSTAVAPEESSPAISTAAAQESSPVETTTAAGESATGISVINGSTAAETLSSSRKTAAGKGYKESYNKESGLYTADFGALGTMSASVPNGMLSNVSVVIDTKNLTGEAASKIEVLKNGVNYEMPKDGNFDEVGSYTLLIPDGAGNDPFSFRIIGGSVGDIDSYTVPDIMTLDGVTLNGSAMELKDKRRVDLTSDGLYDIRMSNPDNEESEISFTADHAGPSFTVQMDNGTATIRTSSDDIAETIVTRNGKSVRYKSGELKTITVPGTYQVVMYDTAGNKAEQTFTLKRKSNAGGLAAVIILIGLAGAGFAFWRNTKGNFKVS